MKKVIVTWESQLPRRRPLYVRMVSAQVREEINQACTALKLGQPSLELLKPFSLRGR